VSGFERRDERLVADDVPLDEAARRYGTPLYVYSRSAVVSAYRAYETAFAPVPGRICYALKANSNGALLRLLAGLGAGADIVSGLELRAAQRAGFAPERITFSGVGKTDDELRQGLQAGIAEFNCESEGEISRLSAVAVERGVRAPISVRVNPDIDPRSHPYISTGLRESKFGIDVAEAAAVLDHARSLPGIEVVGIQCHIGSQMTDLAPIEAAARELAALAERLKGEGFALRSIDIGGGLGVDYEGSGNVPTPQALADRLLPILGGLGLHLVIEPGRSLVAAAGVLLTRVLYVKQNRDKRFVIVDAGMNDLLRPALYEAHHRIEPVLAARPDTWCADVVGPVCESGDFLAKDREMPVVEPGDLLAVRDVGAYGFVMTSNYNLRPRPAEVLLERGTLRLIRRRETFDDLIATEQG
jgi:diaminopimelate decarboxylase